MGPKTIGWLLWAGQIVPKNLWCLVLGHDDQKKNQPGRTFLQCDRCGQETPGWDIDNGKRLVYRKTVK